MGTVTVYKIIETYGTILIFAAIGMGVFWLFASAIGAVGAHREKKENDQDKKILQQKIERNRRDQGQIGLLFGIIIAVVLFGLLAGALSWAQGRGPAETVPPNDGINMIQPQGANPQKDNINSETNLNNSQANLNNAEAAAVPTLTDAEYQLKLAQACALRNDCAVDTFNQGRQEGASEQGQKMLMWAIIIILILFIGSLFMGRRR